MRLRTILIGGAVVIVGLVVAGVVYVSQMDINQYRGMIAEQAKAATGRDLAIKGDLKLALGWSPSIDVNDVTFANAPWGSRPEMLKVGRFEARVELIPLLSGEIRIKRIVLNQPDILLETNAQGQGNWEFGASGAAPAAPAPAAAAGGSRRLPTVNEIEIRDAKLVYRDGTKKGGETMTLALTRATVRADSDTSPLKIDVEGAFNQLKVQIAGQLGPVAALIEPGSGPFPVDVTGRVGDLASFKAKGQIREPAAGKGYDMALSAEGGEVAKLAAFGGFRMAPFGPFKVDIRVNDQAPGGRPSVASLKAELGKPELVLVRADGAIRDPLEQKGITLNIALEGREVGAFSGVAVPGLPPLPPVPAIGPFKGAIRVISGTGDKPAVPELKFEIGKADLIRVVINGAVQDPLDAKGVKIDINIDAPDMTKVAALAGATPPVGGPFKLEAQVADTGPDKYAVKGIKLTVGPGDLAGEAAVNLAGARPVVTANLSSNQIDISKLGSGPASPARPAPAGDKVFSDDPLPYAFLSTADADVRYTTKRLVTSSTTLQNVNIVVALKGGELAVKPLALEVSGGRINGEVAMAARNQSFSSKIEARGVNLGKLLQETKTTEYLHDGPTDFTMDVRGAGRSMRALMASLNGTTTLVVGSGSIDSKLYDVLGADVVKILNPLQGGQSDSKLNCVVQRFEIKDGLATSRVFTIDTNAMSVAGEGTLNFATEVPSMLFDPKPKQTSLLNLATPIRASGTFAKPSFLPDAAQAALGVAKSVGGAALLGPVGIGAAIVGRTQARQAEDVCGAALAQIGISRPGAAAPAATRAPATPTRPGQPAAPQQQQQQQPQGAPGGPVEDLGRGIRGLFGN